MATTFVHMIIALAGATLTGWGAQQLGDDKISKMLYDRCIKQPVPKSSTKSAMEKSCNTKYKPGGEMLHKVAMYGGCGVIVVGFLLFAMLTSQIFGGMGMGMGGGGAYY